MGGGWRPVRVGSQGGIGPQAGLCRAEDAAHGSWMLVHLAKVAIMFGLRSSGGSYEKMRSEYYLDVENPFCAQVGVSTAGFLICFFFFSKTPKKKENAKI